MMKSKSSHNHAHEHRRDIRKVHSTIRTTKKTTTRNAMSQQQQQRQNHTPIQHHHHNNNKRRRRMSNFSSSSSSSSCSKMAIEITRQRPNSWKKEVDVEVVVVDDNNNNNNNNEEEEDEEDDSSLEVPYAMNLSQPKNNHNHHKNKRTKKNHKQQPQQQEEDGHINHTRNYDDINTESDDNNVDDSDSDSDDDSSGGYESADFQCIEPPYRPTLQQPQQQAVSSSFYQHHHQVVEPLRPGDVIAYQNTSLFTAGSENGHHKAVVVLATNPDHPRFPLVLHNGDWLPWEGGVTIRRVAEYRHQTLLAHPGRYRPITQFRMKTRTLSQHQQQHHPHLQPQQSKQAPPHLPQGTRFRDWKKNLESCAMAFLRGEHDPHSQRCTTTATATPTTTTTTTTITNIDHHTHNKKKEDKEKDDEDEGTAAQSSVGKQPFSVGKQPSTSPTRSPLPRMLQTREYLERHKRYNKTRQQQQQQQQQQDGIEYGSDSSSDTTLIVSATNNTVDATAAVAAIDRHHQNDHGRDYKQDDTIQHHNKLVVAKSNRKTNLDSDSLSVSSSSPSSFSWMDTKKRNRKSLVEPQILPTRSLNLTKCNANNNSVVDAQQQNQQQQQPILAHAKPLLVLPKNIHSDGKNGAEDDKEGLLSSSSSSSSLSSNPRRNNDNRSHSNNGNTCWVRLKSATKRGPKEAELSLNPSSRESTVQQTSTVATYDMEKAKRTLLKGKYEPESHPQVDDHNHNNVFSLNDSSCSMGSGVEERNQSMERSAPPTATTTTTTKTLPTCCKLESLSMVPASKSIKGSGKEQLWQSEDEEENTHEAEESATVIASRSDQCSDNDEPRLNLLNKQRQNRKLEQDTQDHDSDVDDDENRISRISNRKEPLRDESYRKTVADPLVFSESDLDDSSDEFGGQTIRSRSKKETKSASVSGLVGRQSEDAKRTTSTNFLSDETEDEDFPPLPNRRTYQSGDNNNTTRCDNSDDGMDQPSDGQDDHEVFRSRYRGSGVFVKKQSKDSIIGGFSASLSRYNSMRTSNDSRKGDKKSSDDSAAMGMGGFLTLTKQNCDGRNSGNKQLNTPMSSPSPLQSRCKRSAVVADRSKVCLYQPLTFATMHGNRFDEADEESPPSLAKAYQKREQQKLRLYGATEEDTKPSATTREAQRKSRDKKRSSYGDNDEKEERYNKKRAAQSPPNRFEKENEVACPDLMTKRQPSKADSLKRSYRPSRYPHHQHPSMPLSPKYENELTEEEKVEQRGLRSDSNGRHRSRLQDCRYIRGSSLLEDGGVQATASRKIRKRHIHSEVAPLDSNTTKKLRANRNDSSSIDDGSKSDTPERRSASSSVRRRKQHVVSSNRRKLHHGASQSVDRTVSASQEKNGRRQLLSGSKAKASKRLIPGMTSKIQKSSVRRPTKCSQETPKDALLDRSIEGNTKYIRYTLSSSSDEEDQRRSRKKMSPRTPWSTDCEVDSPPPQSLGLSARRESGQSARRYNNRGSTKPENRARDHSESRSVFDFCSDDDHTGKNHRSPIVVMTKSRRRSQKKAL